MCSRNVVDAGERHDLAKGRQQLSIRADIGPKIGQHMKPHGQKFTIAVKRKLDFADIVPAMLVGEDDFGSLATPLDWPVQLSCRPQRQTVLDILPALCAEAAS